MDYQVLACKWRPKRFANIIGQEHILIALSNSLSLERIHHAYIFSGIRGIGKTSIARLLAKSLNCETRITAEPCCMCNSCYEIEQGKFVDLIEIDAASRTKVEDMRDILDNVQYMPIRGRFKVYLIDEVHMLSRQSFNALLKTLEEPPAYVKFILATTNPQKLPATILSRCIHFHLKALSIDQIIHRIEFILNKEKIEYDSRAVHLLARAADGSLRDALSLTDQAIATSCSEKLSIETVRLMLGSLDEDQALSLIEIIAEGNGEQAMMLVNKAASHGVEWEVFLVEIQSFLYRIAMFQLSPNTLGLETTRIKQRIKKLAHIISPTDVQFYYQTFLIGRKELPFAPDRRMGLEMTILRALALHSKSKETKTLKSDVPASDSQKEMIPSTEIYSQELVSDLPDTSHNTTSELLVAYRTLQKVKEINQLEDNKLPTIKIPL